MDRCMTFCPSSFGHWIVCSFSISASGYLFGIFKPFLWYRQWLY